MAALKKTDIEKLTPKQREDKIAELELAILEHQGEGQASKIAPLLKTIARLRTPSNKVKSS